MHTQPSPAAHLNDLFLAALSKNGLLQAPDVFSLQTQTKQNKSSVIPLLIQQKKLSAKIIAQQLTQHLNLTFFDLTQFSLQDDVIALLGETFVQAYGVLPLFIQAGELYLAISEPAHLECLKEIKFHTDLPIYPVVVESDKLARLIQAWLSESQYRTVSQCSSWQNHDDQVITWVARMLQDAVYKGASDIHIEPYKTAYRIRFRLDGLLHKITQLPVEIGLRIIARLKIMSRLDVGERRLPQDGRFSIEADEPKDCRISVCPTLFGEKIVVRILDAGKVSLDIADLGLEKTQKKLFLQSIQKPQGMILVTGPTGSGKTVTLYSALRFLNTLEKNICTVEDPVEITLPGINQIHIDLKIQLTFSNVLRSFLRQDPDILMVGEIRDQDTAETAIKAAQTGHLVFSTLHTNGTIETLTRLAMLGISPFNIANTVQLILAQRLVRQLCIHCKCLNAHTGYYEAVGCDACMQGYKGRTAVFECLTLSSEISTLILQGKSEQEIRSAAKNAGMMSLQESAYKKVAAGISTLAEIQRVVE